MRRIVGVFLIGALLLAVASVAAAGRGDSRGFKARLSGANEVPPVATEARGKAHFKLSKDGTQLRYKLQVKRIDGVTAAHIHCGRPGENGPVVVTLYPGAADVRIKESSFRARGVATTLTAVTCPNGAVINTFADLVAQMRLGNTYTNVHTSDHPGGEVRGPNVPRGN